MGNIAYNATQTNGVCASGFSIEEPIASDTLSGTHIYVAGNFSWDSSDPDPCAGGTPTDGEGFIMDTWDGTYTGTSPYKMQAVVENNIAIGNGGPGIEVFQNSRDTPNAPIYLLYNTSWDNVTDSKLESGNNGEIALERAFDTQAEYNLAATNAATGPGGVPMYAYIVENGNSTDQVYNTLGYSAEGDYGAISGSSGFSYGSGNLFGTNPQFAKPSVPGAPSCSGSASVPACMATVIANFTPTNAAAKGYGYQIPSSHRSPIRFSPVALQRQSSAGLTTMGCGTAP